MKTSETQDFYRGFGDLSITLNPCWGEFNALTCSSIKTLLDLWAKWSRNHSNLDSTIVACCSNEASAHLSQSPLWLLHMLLEELDGVTTKPSMRRQPLRVINRWRSLDDSHSALRSIRWCNGIEPLIRMQSQSTVVSESVWKTQVCLMCAKNGQESYHTWTQLLFTALQTQLDIMANYPLSTHSRTVRAIGPDGSPSTLTATFVSKVCHSCQKSKT